MFECLAALKSDSSSMKQLVEVKEEEEEEEEADDDDLHDEVFSLELERGERGLGLALVDTRVSDGATCVVAVNPCMSVTT